MARDLISRYIWLVDTLNRYGRLTRKEINRLWLRSSITDGREIPERTFFHYRRAVEENFSIEIKCDREGAYYIEADDDRQTRALTNWLLDSYAVNSAVKDTANIQGRVSVEDVPSAREFLPIVLDAMGANEKVSFTYAGFNRSRPEKGIVFSPYFVKRYKQRWYMVGHKEGSDIRTYALDRVKEMKILSAGFELPEGMTNAAMFDSIIGVTSSKAQARVVKLMVEPRQAKYFRALPFHASQQEEVHDDYSIFTYRLKLNYELVHELLSYGSAVKVLQPCELETMVRDELTRTLDLYDTAGSVPGRQRPV